MDGQLAAANISTMTAVVEQSLASERFAATLMSAFAAVALVLAVVGLYGVVAYAVSMRTHEVGVRVALGAQRLDIGRMLVGGSMILIGAGIGLGVIGAWVATRAIAGFLFEVEPTDPLTFATVIAILALAGALAAAMPAHRASRVDPAQVLSRK
jgi:ABC-type antimicrobial peptide transport system permease subunit